MNISNTFRHSIRLPTVLGLAGSLLLFLLVGLAGATVSARADEDESIYLPFVTRQTPVRVGWTVGNGDDDLPGIIHTTDGGQTWTRQSVPVTTPELDAGDISSVDERTAWAAFTAPPGVAFPYVLHTTDGGATWITQTLPTEANFGLKSVKGVNRSEAWASTLDGVILRTTDGGANWAVIPHPGIVMTQVNRMDVILPHIWIADSADDGAMIHSSDGGARSC